MNHLKLLNRYVLRCTLASEAAVHVGTGVASLDSDAPVVRENGRPYLPGSSLRGVMRSTVERIMNTLAEGSCCTLFQPEGAAACDAGSQKRREELESLTSAELDRAKNSLRFCPVCRLFGSTLMASRLKVGDAFPQEGDSGQPNRRDGVGIDRDTGTAKDKIKFDFEALEQRCDFQFTVQLENAEPSDLGLLYVALKEMEHGFDVGGKRSRGLGRVKLKGYGVEFFDPDHGHDLRSFLERGLAPMDQTTFEGWLQRGFNTLLQESK